MASVWVLGLTFLGTVPNSLFLSLLFCIQYSATFMHKKSDDQIRFFFFLIFLPVIINCAAKKFMRWRNRFCTHLLLCHVKQCFCFHQLTSEASDCEYSLEIFSNLFFFFLFCKDLKICHHLISPAEQPRHWRNACVPLGLKPVLCFFGLLLA